MATKEFNEGREAYFDDVALKDNPYPTGAPANLDWQKGWREAAENDPLADDMNGDDGDDDDDDCFD